METCQDMWKAHWGWSEIRRWWRWPILKRSLDLRPPCWWSWNISIRREAWRTGSPKRWSRTRRKRVFWRKGPWSSSPRREIQESAWQPSRRRRGTGSSLPCRRPWAWSGETFWRRTARSWCWPRAPEGWRAPSRRRRSWRRRFRAALSPGSLSIPPIRPSTGRRRGRRSGETLTERWIFLSRASAPEVRSRESERIWRSRIRRSK